MKGDFTRLTFRPQRHFTSVRMQQGRLQLDSDWNEQIDIQSHLYRTQVIDMIGSAAGTSDPDAFKLKSLPFSDPENPTPPTDLLITPGHFYVDGILCESELSAPFELTPIVESSSDETTDQPTEAELNSKIVQASTLIVDGVPLAKNQWIALQTEDRLSDPPILRQIVDLDAQLSRLTLNQGISGLTQARRLPTYYTQPDYPNADPITASQQSKFELQVLTSEEYDPELPVSESQCQVEVDSLIVDGSNLQPGEWLAVIVPDLEQPQIVQIVAVKANGAETTLTPGKLTLSQKLPVTDEPYSAYRALFYALYLDVWERHITAVEDPDIREKALGIPDTTTRTKTVWQLKLKSLSELPLPTELSKRTEALNQADPKEALKRYRWEAFLQERRTRPALMTACARLCPTANGAIAPSSEPLKNQLYRVEIHKPGDVKTATFKWSRDNASIASALEKIQDNVVVTKFDQQEWQFSESGQWLEILSTNQELRNEPGVMVPFQNTTLRKITIDRSRATGQLPDGKPPDGETWIVRRWHTGPESEISTSEGWLELEQGIKVKFDANSTYETGDYWLISARVDDIDWANNGKEPLPQPPQGIQHHYGLLAIVQADSQSGELIEGSLNDEKLRLVFSPLQSCLGAAGGTVTGPLEIQNNLYVTDQGTGDDRIDSRFGLGTTKPIARFHLKNPPDIKGKGTLSKSDDDTSVNGTGLTALHPGALLTLNGTSAMVLSTTGSSATLDTDVIATNDEFTYQPAIARLEDSSGTLQLLITAQGNVGIGTQAPTTKLDVNGTTQSAELIVTGATSLKGGATIENGLTVSGLTTLQGGATIANGLTVSGLTTLQGGAAIANGLTVSGLTTLQGGAAIANGLTVSGLTTLQGGAAIANGLTVSTGTTSLQGAATIAGNTTLNGALSLGGVSITAFVTTVPNSDQVVPTAKAVQTYVIDQLGGAPNRDFQTRDLTIHRNLKFDGDPTIIRGFSDTLGNSNTTLPTERAVREYVNNQVETLDNRLDTIQVGSPTQNFAAQNLTVNGVLRLREGVEINQVSANEALTSDSDAEARRAVPTQKAVKAYVDDQIERVSSGTDTNFAIARNLTVSGRAGIGAPPRAGVALHVQGTIEGDVFRGELQTPSSQALKENITDLSDQEAVDLLSRLHPVKFTYKTDADQSLHTGFIAEDSPDLLTSSDKQAVKLTDIVAVLTKALQDDRKAIVKLSRVIKQQQQEIARLTETVTRLENHINEAD